MENNRVFPPGVRPASPACSTASGTAAGSASGAAATGAAGVKPSTPQILQDLEVALARLARLALARGCEVIAADLAHEHEILAATLAHEHEVDPAIWGRSDLELSWLAADALIRGDEVLSAAIARARTDLKVAWLTELAPAHEREAVGLGAER
jgi:hypothetical protein